MEEGKTETRRSSPRNQETPPMDSRVHLHEALPQHPHEALSQHLHEASGVLEFCIRRRRPGEVSAAAFRVGQHAFASEERAVHQRRATASPRSRSPPSPMRVGEDSVHDGGGAAPASSPPGTPASPPRPRRRRRRPGYVAPASSPPGDPASPPRPCRRRETRTRCGCGGVRTSTPMRRVSPEADTGAITVSSSIAALFSLLLYFYYECCFLV